MTGEHADVSITSFHEHDAGSAAADESIPVSRFDAAYALFADGWHVGSVEPTEFELVNATGFKASAWLARIERI